MTRRVNDLRMGTGVKQIRQRFVPGRLQFLGVNAVFAAGYVLPAIILL